FEEGITIDRAGDPIPATERLVRKDVWRLRATGKRTVTFQVQFGEYGGGFFNQLPHHARQDIAFLLACHPPHPGARAPQAPPHPKPAAGRGTLHNRENPPQGRRENGDWMGNASREKTVGGGENETAVSAPKTDGCWSRRSAGRRYRQLVRIGSDRNLVNVRG